MASINIGSNVHSRQIRLEQYILSIHVLLLRLVCAPPHPCKIDPHWFFNGNFAIISHLLEICLSGMSQSAILLIFWFK